MIFLFVHTAKSGNGKYDVNYIDIAVPSLVVTCKFMLLLPNKYKMKDLDTNRTTVTKLYWPRLIFPLSTDRLSAVAVHSPPKIWRTRAVGKMNENDLSITRLFRPSASQCASAKHTFDLFVLTVWKKLTYVVVLHQIKLPYILSNIWELVKKSLSGKPCLFIELSKLQCMLYTVVCMC